MTSSALIDSNLSDLQLLSKGKVRDIYATSDPNLLLFVASDRISAYDVILQNVRVSFPLRPHMRSLINIRALPLLPSASCNPARCLGVPMLRAPGRPGQGQGPD